MRVQARNRIHTRVLELIVILILGIIVGMGFARYQRFVLGVVVTLVLLLISYIFFRLNCKQSWFLWLGIIAISPFGPFLDIITHQPINWLIGLFVLWLFIIRFIRSITIRQNARMAKKNLIIGFVFFIYIGYLFVQILRPGVEFWSALLNWRSPLTGFAAYFLTVSGLWGEQAEERAKNLLKLIGLVSIVVASYAIFQYLIGYTRLASLGLIDIGGSYFHYQRNLGNVGTQIFRITGTFRRNEVLAGYLFFNLIACAAAFRLQLKHRMLLLISLGMSLVAMVLSLSLTNLFLIGIWAFLIFVETRSRWLWWMTIGLGVVGLVAITILNAILGGLITTRLAEHQLDTEQGIGRIAMASNWITEMGNRPFFTGMLGSGLCLGTDEDVLGRIGSILENLNIRVGQSPSCGWSLEIHDNWYATHSLEVGWLSLLLLWFIFALIRMMTLPRMKISFSDPVRRGGWMILALGLLSVWASGFVGALIIYMPLNLFFWGLLGVVEVISISHRDNKLPSV